MGGEGRIIEMAEFRGMVGSVKRGPDRSFDMNDGSETERPPTDRGPAGQGGDGLDAGALQEDLPALVMRASALASQLCHDCVHYHGSWPALRLIERGGLDFDRPYLLSLFTRLASDPSRRHWLVAGMADTGLVATVGAAIWPVRGDAAITLVDRCETPLTLCREYGRRLDRALDTVHADLTEFSPARLQDVVLAHSVLAHLPGARRAGMARRFRQWLGPGGCLVLSARFNDVLDHTEIERLAGPTHIRRMIEALKAKGVHDAATLSRLSIALPRDFADRNRRRGAHASVAEIAALLRRAGFGTVEIVAEYAAPPRRLRPSGKNQRRAIIAAFAE
jgi:hypothetical protein